MTWNKINKSKHNIFEKVQTHTHHLPKKEKEKGKKNRKNKSIINREYNKWKIIWKSK